MGYPTVNNVPLDQIFDPYVSGTKAAITGYTVMVSGVAVDLRDLLAPIYLGSSAPPTNYKVNNADLNTIFAAKGTARYGLAFSGVNYLASGFNVATLSLMLDTASTFAISGTASLVSGSPTSGSINTYGAVTQVMVSNLSYDSSVTASGITPNTWVSITSGLLVLKFSAVGLAGNQTHPTAIVSFMDGAGRVLSRNSVNFSLLDTNPG